MAAVQSDIENSRSAFDRPNPLRKEGEGQAVGGGDLDGACHMDRGEVDLLSPLIELPNHLFRQAAEGHAGLGEEDGLCRTVEQGRPDPLLQRPYAAAECWLSREPKLRGAREITRLRQAQEILEPFQFHGIIVAGNLQCNKTSL